MLGPLLKGILLETALGLDEAGVDLLKVGAVAVDVLGKRAVLLLELLVLIALLRIKVIELALVGHVDLLDLSLNVGDLVLHVTLLCEHLV